MAMAMRRVLGLTAARRSFSSFSQTTIFDRSVKRQQRNNIAALADGEEYEYLKDEVARRLVDRLEDIDREFPMALDLGCGSGHIYKTLSVDDGLGGVKMLLQCDSAEKLLLRDVQEEREDIGSLQTEHLIVDEEYLPFPPNHFDLVASSLSLHWVNDLPSTFQQIRDCLKPDGVFLAAIIGGDSLQELRSALILGDQERQGGISPHISPFANVPDVGNLMQGAGFTLCTVDTDYIEVHYPNAFVLMEHLQKMGENNAVLSKGRPPTRDSLLAAASIYQSMYANEDGSVPATFQIIYMIGWAPHDSQPKPLRRGTAQHSLKELARDETTTSGSS